MLWLSWRVRGAWLAGAALLVAVAGWGGVAAAEEAGAADSREARAAFVEGARLFEAGEHGAALASFRRAQALRPHPVTLYNIAWCLSRLDDPVAALGAFESYLVQSEGDASERVARAREEAGRLRGQVGWLEVRVEPAGAEVRVGEERLELRAGAARVRVRAGTHRLTARAEGHEAAGRQVVVRAGGREEVTLRLEPSPARLQVTTTPAGAALSVDGREVGRSPWSGAVAPGDRLVRARVEGHRIAEARVVARPGAAHEVDLALVRATGVLSVAVSPPGRAVVEVDGVRVDAPAELEAGARAVAVSAPGRRPWAGQVEVGPAGETRLEVRLARRGLDPRWFWSMLGLTLAAGAALVVTGAVALDYGARWRLDWDRNDRDRAAALVTATDSLLVVAGTGALVTLLVGLRTSFRPDASTAETSFVRAD